MENTEVPTISEESKTVVESISEEPSKLVDDQEQVVEAKSTAEPVEPKEDDIVPVTVDETTKPIDEQENVTGTDSSVAPASFSPGRVNVPLKEVNESDKEDAGKISNGTSETANGKKRELEHEDEPVEENGDDDRAADQTKKMKTNEPIDTPISETKDLENNHVMNGNAAGVEA